LRKSNDNSNLKSNVYANTEENHINDNYDNSMENLKELYENPNSKTRLSQYKPLKNIKISDYIKKNNNVINNQKNNFRRLNFHENQNFSELLADIEKKEKKSNKENANIQNIINLKDCIMKLGSYKYISYLYL